jgi:hypothetical protein
VETESRELASTASHQAPSQNATSTVERQANLLGQASHSADALDFPARIEVVTDPPDLVASESLRVLLRRESDGSLQILDPDTSGAWEGVLPPDSYRVVGAREKSGGISPPESPELSPRAPRIRVELRFARSWMLEVLDAETGLAPLQGVTLRMAPSGTDLSELRRAVPLREEASSPIEVPEDTESAVLDYLVSAVGYADARLRHSSGQGGARVLLWPSGSLIISRDFPCAITVQRMEDALWVHAEDEVNRAEIELPAIPRGRYEVVASWPHGVLRREVELRAREASRLELRLEPEEALTSRAKVRLLTQITPGFAKRIEASWYRKIQQLDSTHEPRAEWARCWRLFRTQTLQSWAELDPGAQYLSPSTELTPGLYRLELSALGLQHEFDILPGVEREILVEAYDLVPTRIEFIDWEEKRWPISLLWRYDGDAYGLSELRVERSESPVELCFLRRPLTLRAMGSDFSRTPSLRHEPELGDREAVLQIRGDRMAPRLIVELWRAGRLAWLDPELRFELVGLDPGCELVSRETQGSSPSALFFRLSQPGRYRLTGELRGRQVCASELLIQGDLTRAVLELEP